MMSSIYNTASICSLIFPNHQFQNMPNLYNLLISILLINDSDKKSEIIQLIKLNLGLTFYDGFRQYIIKKYPIDHDLVKLVK